MLNYTLKRILIAVPVFFGILLLAFVFVQLLPGDPATMMIPIEEFSADSAFIERRRAEMGLDRAIPLQFLGWVRELFNGNLGYSFHRQGVPVTELLLRRAGPTLLLTSFGVGIALLIGIPIGIAAALRQNTLFDYISAAFSMLAISIPNFFLALSGIYVFALILGWVPTAGYGPLGAERTFTEAVRYLILPGTILAAVLVGPYVRYTRQSLLEVLRQDYMTTATAKGVTRQGVVVLHGLRNALIPLTTVMAIQIPSLLAGTVIIETIFAWPGMGRLVLEAIQSRDYPIIIGVVMVSAVLVMLFNLLADLLAAVLDPRIRL